MDWLRSSAQRLPDAPALICGDEVISYAALDAVAQAVASALTRAGVAAGERVALWARGTAGTAAAIWGIPRAGAVPVLLGTRLTSAEAAAMARASQARAQWGPGPGLGLPRPVEEGASLPARHQGPPDAHARIVVFTSGTSGRARPVVLTGANVAASAAASQARLGNGAGDHWLGVLPLHHVGGLAILWRSAREGGAVVLEERFAAPRAAQLLASGGVAFASLVPTMLRRLLDQHPGPFPGVRAVLIGGGPSDPDLLARARAAGLPVLATYGLSETASQMATEAPAEAGTRPGSVGRPLDGFEVRVVDEAGGALPPETEGRLAVRGAAVSPGYLGEAERPPGAWLVTGDLGHLDEEGYLYVAGRADEVIVTGGEKVHPAEVEGVLCRHPGVADAKVFGEPDPEWGERVVAEVVPAIGTPFDPVALAAHARARLARYKVPRRWVERPRIDRTDMDKPIPTASSPGLPG
jgi:O-succinylbenzoic acid--CoA ligase